MTADAIRRPTAPARVRVWADDRWRERPDQLVTEEPMEIRLAAPGGAPTALAVLMRTPGHDFELAVGFCITEGLFDDAGQVAEVRYCVGPEGDQEYNIVTIATRGPVAIPERSFVSNASCGVCGKATLDDLEVHCAPVGPGPTFPIDALVGFPDRLRAAQSVFDATGGLHAAALMTVEGLLTEVREDVGRHNAVDKLVGHAAMRALLPLTDVALVVSGRVSFEIVQKAARAGVPVIAAVSAPSSLAVATAERFGISLVGFVRDDGCNVYSGAERIVGTAAVRT